MKKHNSKKYFIGLAVAVLLPLSFYLITNKLSKGKVIMPGHYGIARIDTQNTSGNPVLDTLYRQVQPITLTNQLGEQVDPIAQLRGKMLVLNFIFTNCTTTCPQLMKSMLVLQKGFRKDPKKEASLDTVVQFVSISIDPAVDSFPVLRAYADRYGVNHDHWWLLTGDKKTIYRFIREELGLITGEGDGGAEDFIHTQKMVLLDRDRYIRGYYDGLDPLAVRKCADDIVLLTLEKKKKKKH